MAGGGDREEFGEAFDDSEDDDSPYRHTVAASSATTARIVKAKQRLFFIDKIGYF